MTPTTMTAEYEALMRENHSAPDALFAELDAERAAHQETQAKLDRSTEPPDNEAWKSVVKYAYADGGDGARNINSITSHYIAMRNQLAESQAISRELLSVLERYYATHQGGSDGSRSDCTCWCCKTVRVLRAKARGVLPENVTASAPDTPPEAK